MRVLPQFRANRLPEKQGVEPLNLSGEHHADDELKQPTKMQSQREDERVQAYVAAMYQQRGLGLSKES